MKLISYLIVFGVSLQASAQRGWEAVTNDTYRLCSRETACNITEPDGNTYNMIFTTKTAGSKRTLTKVTIRNLKTGAEQEFTDLGSVRPVDEASEYFELSRVRLRPSGEMDFALYAFNSALEDATYYYFLYEPKTQSFVMTGTFPRLRSKGNAYLTEMRDTRYVLGKDLHFRLAPGQ